MAKVNVKIEYDEEYYPTKEDLLEELKEIETYLEPSQHKEDGWNSYDNGIKILSIEKCE